MARAFPSLTAAEREQLDRRGIDIERSFRDWLEQLTGKPADEVEALIERAAGEILGEPGRSAGDGMVHGRLVRADTPLTTVERDVLRLRAMGYSNREVAAAVSKSYETVRTCVRRSLIRLGARNTEHALVIALARGELQSNQ